MKKREMKPEDEYWKRRYDTLIDTIKEHYGAAIAISLLEEVHDRLDRNRREDPPKEAFSK